MIDRLLLALTACAALILVPVAAAAELPRRSMLGARLSPVDGGSRVDSVMPGFTADRLGMRTGDVIVDGYPLSGPTARPPLANTALRVTIRRDGRTMTLRGKAVAKTRESYPGARTIYGEVAFGGGKLRDVLVLPEGVRDPPVVFLIQGYTCFSIESVDPNSLYRKMGAALIKAGIGFYRVEKPGMGDSSGGQHCRAMDYLTELAAFRAAYRHMTDEMAIAADRIILFGHSMGGIQAPMLAAERAPRGVAVYGTVLRNWADYWHDIDVYQGFLLTGADPVAEYAKSEARREILRRYFFEKQSPRAIAAARPDLVAQMTATLEWDGADDTAGRHYAYFQQLAAVDLVKAWAETRSQVLSLYGESDVVALFDTDQQIIADIANHYRPGTGEYVGFPDTGHGMDLIGDRASIRRRAAAGEPDPRTTNPAVFDRLIAWIGAIMAKPPVAG